MKANVPSEREDINTILAQLSIRHAVQSERYLVGRNELLRSLVGCCEGSQRSFAWIYGARRIGKSSVAQSVSRQAEKNNTRAVYVDAGGASSFCDLVHAITHAAGSGSHGSAREDNVRELEALVRSSSLRPLLFVIDEADSVALNLRVSEQATFRRLAHEHPRFSCLFVSRSSPATLVEEVPDVNSRLLGICNQRRVKPLALVDIEELCERVRADLKCSLPGWLPTRIWDAVGGISVAVMSAVHAVAVRQVEGRGLSKAGFDDLLESDLAPSLRRDFQGFWWDLDPECRIGLLAEMPTARQERRLREEGLVHRAKVVRPALLMSQAVELGVALANSPIARDEIASVEKLFSLLVAVNNTLKLNGQREGFRVTTDTVKFFLLTRHSCSQEDLAAAIDYLYGVFFEGARDRKGSKEYLLPAPLGEQYKGARVIGDISDIRNFVRHTHGLTTDHEQTNVSYREAGDIFERRAGKRELTSDDERRRFRRSVVEDLVSLLEVIHDTLNESGQGPAASRT